MESRLLHCNITLNPANKKTDESMSDFQTGIGAVVHATLGTKQLMSHTTAAFVDTIGSLQDSERGVISVPDVHELLANIHDILDSAVSK